MLKDVNRYNILYKYLLFLWICLLLAYFGVINNGIVSFDIFVFTFRFNIFFFFCFYFVFILLFFLCYFWLICSCGSLFEKINIHWPYRFIAYVRVFYSCNINFIALFSFFFVFCYSSVCCSFLSSAISVALLISFYYDFKAYRPFWKSTIQ